jgi:hypothetical protein
MEQPERFRIFVLQDQRLVMVLCNLCEKEWDDSGRFWEAGRYINLPDLYQTATEAKAKADSFAQVMEHKRAEDCKHC